MLPVFQRAIESVNAESEGALTIHLYAWLQELDGLVETHLPDEFETPKSVAKLHALTLRMELDALSAAISQHRFGEISSRLVLISSDLDAIEACLGTMQTLLQGLSSKWVQKVLSDVSHLLS